MEGESYFRNMNVDALLYDGKKAEAYLSGAEGGGENDDLLDG